MRERLHYRQPGEVPARCGRPTKAATPCRNRRMPEQADLFAVVVAREHREYVPPSCSKHATDEEHAEHWRIMAATGEILEAGTRAARAAERVHCWDWPVTDEHRASMAEIAATADATEARYLSMRLLAEWQDGRCGICADYRATRFLDHSHETGLVRGYLCKYCNTGEGFRRGAAECVFTPVRRAQPCQHPRAGDPVLQPVHRLGRPGVAARPPGRPEQLPGVRPGPDSVGRGMTVTARMF